MEKEERDKSLFGDIASELKIQDEIESYDNIMEQRPKYKVWYNLCLALDSIGYQE